MRALQFRPPAHPAHAWLLVPNNSFSPENCKTAWGNERERLEGIGFRRRKHYC